MAIIVRAGAGEACCIMGLIHIKDCLVILAASWMALGRRTPSSHSQLGQKALL